MGLNRSGCAIQSCVPGQIWPHRLTSLSSGSVVRMVADCCRCIRMLVPRRCRFPLMVIRSQNKVSVCSLQRWGLCPRETWRIRWPVSSSISGTWSSICSLCTKTRANVLGAKPFQPYATVSYAGVSYGVVGSAVAGRSSTAQAGAHHLAGSLYDGQYRSKGTAQGTLEPRTKEIA